MYYMIYIMLYDICFILKASLHGSRNKIFFSTNSHETMLNRFMLLLMAGSR